MSARTPRARLLALTQDRPALWRAETTLATERTQRRRCLIQDVTLTKQAKPVRVAIRWQTKAGTRLEVARPPRAYEARRTDRAVIEPVRQLADRSTDAQGTEHLDAQGFLPGMGGRFTADKVQWIRYAYPISSDGPQTAAPRGSAEMDATVLRRRPSA